MQYTLRCRDGKSRRRRWDEPSEWKGEITKNEIYNMLRCRVKTASTQLTFWQARRNEKETTSGTRGAEREPRPVIALQNYSMAVQTAKWCHLMIKTTVDHFACFDNSEMFSSDPRYHDENDMNKTKEKHERNESGTRENKNSNADAKGKNTVPPTRQHRQKRLSFVICPCAVHISPFLVRYWVCVRSVA